MARNLLDELIEKGCSKEQAESILLWTETLPIHITGNNTAVFIKNGVVVVHPADQEFKTGPNGAFTIATGYDSVASGYNSTKIENKEEN